MLGAGLVDLQSPQDSINKDSPLIILCEGVNAEEDSKFYNTLFKYEARHSMFISAQGEAQLFYNYLYFLSVKDEISANFEIVSLKDRDNKFASIEDIKNEVELKPGLKYTYKRAKELYIYNEETMNYFRDAKKTKIISEKKKVFDAEIIRIEDKTNAKESCSYKGIKGKWLDLFETKIDPKEITETKIAEIIRNNKDTSEIYKELHDLIFN